MIRYLLKLAATGLLVIAATAASAQSDIFKASQDYRVVTVAEGLLQPWSMAWLPGGDMLVTEKPGRLRIIRDGPPRRAWPGQGRRSSSRPGG